MQAEQAQAEAEREAIIFGNSGKWQIVDKTIGDLGTGHYTYRLRHIE